eukprot:13617229-Ditylum_brightwellii.AAC.1
METVIQGKKTLSLCSKLEYNWVLSEKAYAFTSNKASLANSVLNAKTKLHIMGEYLDYSALVQVNICKWICLAHEQIIKNIHN